MLILKCVIFLLQFSLFYVRELFDADISHENIVSNIFHSLLLKLEYVVSAVIKSLCFRCVRDQQDFYSQLLMFSLSCFPDGVLFYDRLSAERLSDGAGQRRRELVAEVVGEV